MSVFSQQLNPITGILEWGIMPKDYDYKQEVARSAYADMLHDKERVCGMLYVRGINGNMLLFF